MPRTKVVNGNHDIRGALKELKDKANAQELQIIDYVASLYEDIKEKKDEVVERVQDTSQAINDSVHLHPWRFIGGAALAGLVVGLFLRR